MNLQSALFLGWCLLSTAVSALAQSPTMSLTRSEFSFNSVVGQTNPPVQTALISNSGSGTLTWTASASTVSGGSWLSVSPTSGTGTGATGAITASANIAGLPTGQYSGTILVTAPGATNSPLTISVALGVIPPYIVFSQYSLNFIAGPGTNPPPQTAQVYISGNIPMGLSVSASTFTVTPTGEFISGPNWLSATPGTGTSPLTLTVSAAASTLPPGSYQGGITVTPTPASPGVYAQGLEVTLVVGLPWIGGVVNGRPLQPAHP
jgi:hypothetical protein